MKWLHIFVLFLPSLIFFLAFVSISLLNEGVKKETEQMKLPKQFLSHFSPAPYPIVTITMPQLFAESALVIDNDSKIILFSKNKDTRFSMASTVKIMTALVALEHYTPDDILTVQSTVVPPAVVGYSFGEKVPFFDALYGMLLPSGNDAALAIAQNYPGGEKAFIARMNEKAKELHLEETHFSDSSGLDDFGDYTTVVDLAKLASIALQNPTFAQIVSTKNKTIVSTNNKKSYTLNNLNQLLGSYGVNGVKTGFTPDAGGILVTSSKNGGHTLISVVMKSEDRFADTEKLLSALDTQIDYVPIAP